MTINISELMDGLGDEALEFYGSSPVSAERVLSLARARSGKRKRPRRLGRILLVAAALTALLTVTAYGVYTHFVEDYVIEQPAADPFDLAPAEEQSAARLSLVGYQGTPEYRAYVEWDAMQEGWWEEKKALWEQEGLDDSWHETPENYWGYYDADTREQAAELDALVEKYGLTLHRHRSVLLREGDDYTMLGLVSLCELLDMDLFIHGPCDAYGGYVYDDGSFKLEAFVNDDWNGPDRFSMFLSAKGSFTTISGHLPADYEQWSYTAGGQELTLALAETGGIILGELPGAYVELSSRAQSREALEALASSVDFAALAERFDGTPLDLAAGMAEMDEKYDAWLAGYMAAHDPHPEAGELPRFADDGEALDYALERLGDWDWQAPPAGYAPVWRKGLCQPVKVWQPDAGAADAYAVFVSGYYFDKAAGKGLSLIYMRPYADTALTESVCAWEMEAERRMEPEGTAFDLEGCPALYTPSRYGVEPQSTLFWLDEERDLVFQLSVQGEQTPRETLEEYARALLADMDGK